MQHKNLFLDTGKSPKKVELKNEHEFLFSLVKNNFLLMFTVAAQAVWLWGSWRSRQDASLGEKRNISPTAVAEGSLPNLITAFVNLPPCSASKQSQHQIRPCQLLQHCLRQFHTNVNVPIPPTYNLMHTGRGAHWKIVEMLSVLLIWWTQDKGLHYNQALMHCITHATSSEDFWSCPSGCCERLQL